MMRFFEKTIKQAGRLRHLDRWILASALSAVPVLNAQAQTADVFSQMGDLTQSAETGLRGQLVGVAMAVGCTVLGLAYLVGQQQWAKQYQKSIVVAGVILAVAGGIVTFFGLSASPST